jgi:hypothetical protein
MKAKTFLKNRGTEEAEETQNNHKADKGLSINQNFRNCRHRESSQRFLTRHRGKKKINHKVVRTVTNDC